MSFRSVPSLPLLSHTPRARVFPTRDRRYTAGSSGPSHSLSHDTGTCKGKIYHCSILYIHVSQYHTQDCQTKGNFIVESPDDGSSASYYCITCCYMMLVHNMLLYALLVD